MSEFDPIESRTVKGFTANLLYDNTGASDPRKMYENLGTFFGFHRRYCSPDTPPHSDHEQARRIANAGDNICIPVWMYDHSGTCYRAAETNPFHCPWDSGLFGFIYCTRADARKALGKSRLMASDVETVKEILRGEVETYSAWANGEVYGWEVLDPQGEQVDSCWGYIGETEYPMQEAIESAAWHAGVTSKEAA